MQDNHYINDLLKALKLNVKQLEDGAGLGNATIRNAMKSNGERTLSIATVDRISNFLEKEYNVTINKNWLRTGEGNMFLSTSDKLKALNMPIEKTGDKESLMDYLVKTMFENQGKKINDLEKEVEELKKRLEQKSGK